MINPNIQVVMLGITDETSLLGHPKSGALGKVSLLNKYWKLCGLQLTFSGGLTVYLIRIPNKNRLF